MRKNQGDRTRRIKRGMSQRSRAERHLTGGAEPRDASNSAPLLFTDSRKIWRGRAAVLGYGRSA